MQLHVNIVHFLKRMGDTHKKNIPPESWIQLMTGGFKTVSLAWVNKIAGIGYTRSFVYESAQSYEEEIHAPPLANCKAW